MFELVHTDEYSEEIDLLMLLFHPSRRTDFESAIEFQISRDPFAGVQVNDFIYVVTIAPPGPVFPRVVIVYEILNSNQIALLAISEARLEN
jgi:hypothetical protein